VAQRAVRVKGETFQLIGTRVCYINKLSGGVKNDPVRSRSGGKRGARCRCQRTSGTDAKARDHGNLWVGGEEEFPSRIDGNRKKENTDGEWGSRDLDQSTVDCVYAEYRNIVITFVRNEKKVCFWIGCNDSGKSPAGKRGAGKRASKFRWIGLRKTLRPDLPECR
jgi:hypothetical protein